MTICDSFVEQHRRWVLYPTGWWLVVQPNEAPSASEWEVGEVAEASGDSSDGFDNAVDRFGGPVEAPLYDLDLADGWRSLLEQHMLEDTDSEMLYQNAMDGFEGDVELNMQLGLAPMKIQDWFEPFNDASVPPYVR